MALSYVGTTTAVATGTTTASPALPAGAAAGDRIYIAVVSSPPTSALTVPAEWAQVLSVSLGTTVTAAAGVGPRRFTILKRDYDGAWTMPSVSVSGTGNGIVAAAHAIRKAATEAFVDETTASGSDTGTGTTLGPVTGNAVLDFTNGDIAMMLGGTSDSTTFSAQTLTGATGATIGTVTERSDGGTTTGHAMGASVWTAPITAGGPATAAPIAQATVASTDGGIAFMRVRVAAAPAVTLQPSRPRNVARFRAANW